MAVTWLPLGDSEHLEKIYGISGRERKFTLNRDILHLGRFGIVNVELSLLISMRSSGYHALITWLSCTDHVVDPTLITRLTMH